MYIRIHAYTHTHTYARTRTHSLARRYIDTQTYEYA